MQQTGVHHLAIIDTYSSYLKKNSCEVVQVDLKLE